MSPRLPVGMSELDYLRMREAARMVTSRTATRYVHEDTSRSLPVHAGYATNPDGTPYISDGRRVAMWGNRTLTVCGYWFDSFEGHEKYWRWNKEGRAVDCPKCLLKMVQDP